MRRIASGWRLMVAVVCVGFLAGGASAQSDAALSQVYLVQNSGWMEPFYADQGSQFRDVVTTLIDRTQLEGVATVVATFNQSGQIPGHASPEQIFAGAYDKAGVARAVGGIAPARRADGKYADSDFYGALNGAVTGLLAGHQGIIWMVTNNKASPSNSQQVLANTAKFYDDLRRAPFFTRLIAFPIRMRVTGPHYDERGFIIYGIAYGERAAAALDFLVADGQPVRSVFSAPPVRLKPLDRDPLKLQLSAQAQNGMRVSLEGGRLVVRHVPATGARLSLLADLVNAYYPQQLNTAKLAVSTDTVGGVAPFAAALSQSDIRNLAPGAAVKNIRVDLQFSPMARPSIFKDHVEVEGRLYLNLSDATLTLSPEFVERMKDVFGIDMLMHDQRALQINGLPNVFFDYQRVNAAQTAIPIHLVYDFSPWPAILALVGGLLGLAFVAGGLVVVVRARRYVVRVGNANVAVRIKPFERRVVQNALGERAAVTGAMFGPPSVMPLEAGAQKNP